MDDIALTRPTKREELDRLNLAIMKAEATSKAEDKVFAEQEAQRFFRKYHDVARDHANLVRRVEDQLIESFPGGHYSQVPIREMLEEKRTALGYEESSEVERLAIDRLLACWLRVQIAEMRTPIASDMKSAEASRNLTQLWDKRLTLANRAFLQGVRTLADIRRKPMPRIVAQVNINNEPRTGRAAVKSNSEHTTSFSIPST